VKTLCPDALLLPKRWQTHHDFQRCVVAAKSSAIIIGQGISISSRGFKNWVVTYTIRD